MFDSDLEKPVTFVEQAMSDATQPKSGKIGKSSACNQIWDVARKHLTL
jgi:hypothetical protein